MSKYLDQYDYKIILLLLQDARITFSAIAKELGVTDVAVKKRFERLVSKGIIRRLSVDLDYAQIGIFGEIVVLLKVDPVIEDKAVLTLKEDDSVKTIYRLVGDYNVMFHYLVKDISQIPNVDKLLSKVKGILDFKFMIVSEKVYEKQNIPISSLQVYYSQ